MSASKGINGRTQTGQARGREAELNASIAVLSAALIASASMDDISQLVLEHARRLTSSALGFVSYIDLQSGRLVAPAMPADVCQACQIADPTAVFAKSGGLWGWIIQNRQPLFTNNLLTDPRSAGTPAGHIPIHRFLAVPALVEGTLVGLIALANSTRDYTGHDLELIEQLARLYALAIQRWQAERNVRQHSEFLRSVLEAIPNPFYVINTADYTIEIANSATAMFGNLTDKTTCYALTHNRPLPCSSDDHPCPLEEVKRTKKPVTVIHTHWDREGRSRFFEVHGYPILDEAGNVVQMIEHSLDITERRVAEEALQRFNRDLHLLNQWELQLTATHNKEEAIEFVLRAVLTLIVAEGAMVWLQEEDRAGWLVCKGAMYAGLLTWPANLRIHAGENVVEPVVGRGETVIVPQRGEGGLFPSAVDETLGFQVRSMLAAPLRVREGTLGMLAVVNKLESDFDDHDAMLIETLAASVAIAIENTRLQERIEQAAMAAERSRLARELHDAVSQTLFSASIMAESLPRLWERDPAAVREGLVQLHQLTRGALAEMRMLLLELRPQVLTASSMADLLRQLTDAVVARTGATISLDVEELLFLPPLVKTALYRIAQEALNNVVKHAKPTQVTVSLRYVGGQVELVIADNGRGFDPAQVPPGRLGLDILRERAASIGASLQIASRPDQGTQVQVTWSPEEREAP